jgi:hypothetical protein
VWIVTRRGRLLEEECDHSNVLYCMEDRIIGIISTGMNAMKFILCTMILLMEVRV